MPWTKDDVDDHKKDLTDAQKEQWVEVANSALKKCMEDGGSEETCAISAIKQANGSVERNEEKPELETRNYEEIRATSNTRTVEGYAIVFNELSKDLGGFREVILPEAVDGVFERSDVLALLNHDLSRGVLARSTKGKGSLKLSVDNKGVLYRYTAPNTVLGNELIEGIERGDIRTSSFAFAVSRDGQQWDIKVKPAIRTIKKFDVIYDVSAVYREAYENTTVALRSLDEIGKVEIPVEESKPVTEEPIIVPMEKPKRVMSLHEIELRKRNELLRENSYLTIKKYFK